MLASFHRFTDLPELFILAINVDPVLMRKADQVQ